MYEDYQAFLDIKSEIRFTSCSGCDTSIMIPLNMPTGLFFRLIAITDLLSSKAQTTQKTNEIVSFITDLFKLSNKHISEAWVRRNIYFETMLSIIEAIAESLSKYVTLDAFNVPEISVKPKSYKDDDIKKKIAELEIKLSDKLPQNLAHSITILCAKTSNTYQDIMDMPILVFKDLLKNIIIDENKTNDEWHLAYLKQCEKEYINNYSANLNAHKEKPKRANLAKLKQMLS